jgi:hypothetical protein
VCACGINCLTLDVRDSASMLYRIVWVLLYLGDYGVHLHTRDVDIMTLSAPLGSDVSVEMGRRLKVAVCSQEQGRGGFG